MAVETARQTPDYLDLASFLMIPVIHSLHLVFISQLIMFHMTHMSKIVTNVIKHHFSLVFLLHPKINAVSPDCPWSEAPFIVLLMFIQIPGDAVGHCGLLHYNWCLGHDSAL